MKYLNVPMNLKAMNEDGTFNGYASIFGNKDLGGDIVVKGAFKELVRNQDGKVTVLWQHGVREPIGVADVEQDDVGLKFEGSLVLDDPVARRARAHMKAGSVRGMSIGYDVLPGGQIEDEDGTRRLTGLKLWEISVVTFGMNPKAQIERVKSAHDITTIREFEDWLREEAGLSNGESKQLVARLRKAFDGPRDEALEASDVDRIVRHLYIDMNRRGQL